MRSIAMPRRSHQTESLERLKRAFGLAKGTPLSERMASGKPRSTNSRSKAVKASSSRIDSRASHKSRKRDAWSVTGSGPLRQRRAVRTMAWPAGALDEAVAVEHRMDGAAGGNPDVAGQAADQQLADLACAPMWLLALEADDKAFDWRW
jgi:hypothetical protein